MLRLIWLFILGYVVWKAIQIAKRVLANRGSPEEFQTPPQSDRPKTRTGYSDIKDADFEDITGKDESKKGPAPE